jgi:hypothetical protein
METKNKGTSENLLEDPFTPDKALDAGPGIEDSIPNNEPVETGTIAESRDENVLGSRLRGIERDSIISFEAANKAGATLSLGSLLYISAIHNSVPEKIQESLPEELSEYDELPGHDELDELVEYIPEDVRETSAEAFNQILDEAPEDIPAEEYLKDIESIEERLMENIDEEEIIHHLNKDTTEWSELEGIEPVDNYGDLIEQWPSFLENGPDIILTGFDEIAHFGIGGYMASLGARAVDKATGDYDPKKVALGGMVTVPLYAVTKEGWYEGGNDIDFHLQSADVMGDWIMDTLGASYGTWRYHKKKTASEETDPGISGKLARKIGRAYGRAEHMLENDSYDNQKDVIKGTDLDDLEIALDDSQNYGESGILAETYLETDREPGYETGEENQITAGLEPGDIDAVSNENSAAS